MLSLVRRIMLGAACVFLILLSGCTSVDKLKETSVQVEPLRFMLPGEASNFDPGITGEIYASPFIYHAFEPLVRLSETGEVMPGVAERWEISTDGKKYVFYLNKSAKWSDGTNITAEQFKESWLRMMAPKSDSASVGTLLPFIVNGEKYNKGMVSKEVVGIKSLDAYTLEVTLNKQTPFFLEMIAYWAFSPVRLEIVNEMGANWAKSPTQCISNGPYQLVEYTPGVQMIIEKNPYYWNKDHIAIEKIIFLFKQEGVDPYTLYVQGDIDGIYQVKPVEKRTMVGVESDIHINQAMSTAIIYFNHESKRFKSLELRKALSLSVDRKKIVDEVLLGAGTPSQYLIPSILNLNGKPLHSFSSLDVPPDYTHARTLIKKLKSNGVFKEPIHVSYMIGGPDEEVIKSVVANWEKELDIKMELEGMSWPELYKFATTGDYDIMMLGYTGDYPHPMNFLSLFTSNSISSIVSRWSDKNYDTLFYKAMQASDDALLATEMVDLEAAILNEHHILPLYHRKTICLMSDRVQGWYRNALSEFVFTEAHLVR